MSYFMAKSKFGPLGFRMEKVEKVHFPFVVVLFDMKKGIQIQHLRNSRGHGNLVTLAKGHFSICC